MDIVYMEAVYPEDTREIVLDFRSSTGKVNLLIGPAFVAWPKTEALEASLMELPFLDQLGQVRAVDWPGKTPDLQAGRQALTEALDQANEQASEKDEQIRRLDRPNSRQRTVPHRKSRRAMVAGRSGGHLFFSVGACLTGWRAETSAESKRANKFLRLSSPAKNYLSWTAMFRKLRAGTS